MSLEILYEDNHILSCIKPAGVLSQEDHTGDSDMLTLIKDYLKVKYNKPGNVFVGLVHRLDRPVAGVMVFAKTSKAASRLSDQIRTHTFKKKYMAVIHGVPQKSGTFRDFLLKNEKTNMVSVVEAEISGGKEALLDYSLIKTSDFNNKNLSLMEIDLHTGRPHQIRVQFASRKLPLLGDLRYGIDKTGEIALWSKSITIMHPTTKETLIFEKEPPKIEWPWSVFN